MISQFVLVFVLPYHFTLLISDLRGQPTLTWELFTMRAHLDTSLKRKPRTTPG